MQTNERFFYLEKLKIDIEQDKIIRESKLNLLNLFKQKYQSYINFQKKPESTDDEAIKFEKRFLVNLVQLAAQSCMNTVKTLEEEINALDKIIILKTNAIVNLIKDDVLEENSTILIS